LLGFFWGDWMRIVRDPIRSVRTIGIAQGDADPVLGWLVVTGTIPVGLLGLALEHPLPIIGAAAALELPDLLEPAGHGLRGPALVGALCGAATAYVSVRLLMRFLESNRLTHSRSTAPSQERSARS
jgi:undecaprenyl pyrophosphate phosphatase UppP